MSSEFDLRLSPFNVDIHVILDVLAAVGRDLAHSSEQETITRSLHERMIRDRQGLELVSRMLKELAARHAPDGDARKAEGIIAPQKTTVVASDR